MAGVSNAYRMQNVSVEFPNKPYQSQMCMMQRVLEGIKTTRNCLLESPTGSGKSLALLCAALAWQKAETERVAAMTDEECAEYQRRPSDNGSNIGDAGQTPAGVAALPSDGAKHNNGGGGFLSASQQRRYEDPDLADFKPPPKRFKRLHGGAAGQEDDGLVVIEPVGPGPNPYHQQLPEPEPREQGSPVKQKPRKPRVPRIYFGTRTHKQIEQLVRELKKTAYRGVRMTILSSREQTCINPQFKSSHYKSKTEMCRHLLDPIEGMGCSYNANVPNMSHHEVLQSRGCPEPWDIEDLIQIGRRHRTCPYFVAKNLVGSSQLIFCPYNYLIDPLITKAMNLNLNGEVVILDEAHNIEDVSREAASLDVELEDLTIAAEDCRKVGEAGFLRDSHSALKCFLSKLAMLVDDQKDSLEGKDYNRSFKHWNGTEAIAQFDVVGIGCSDYPPFKNEVNSVLTQMAQLDPTKELTHTICSKTRFLLDSLVQTMDFLYSDNMRYRDDYYVAIVRTLLTGYNKSVQPLAADITGYLNASSRPATASSRWVMKLSFWCQNPAVVFRSLADQTRTIVLSSGTLAPIDSFQSELGTQFKIQLEANHVIHPSQVWVGSISQGPTGHKLDGTFRNTSTFEFQDEVGRIVLEVCENVQHGVLCFLPSYSLMDKLVERWRITGLMDQLKQVKLVLTEPRRGGPDLERTMQQFYDSIARSEMPPEEHQYDDEEEEEQEEEEQERHTGALFLAIMRGKVSEGFDFPDNNARTVITVGIPYPNVNDVQVKLKMKYNDENRKRGVVSGSRWLNIQAFRALNQALGRCIRHRNDWGAILMVDARFSSSDARYTDNLSKWIKKRQVTHFSQWGNLIRDLRVFVQTQTEKNRPQSLPDKSGEAKTSNCEEAINPCENGVIDLCED